MYVPAEYVCMFEPSMYGCMYECVYILDLTKVRRQPLLGGCIVYGTDTGRTVSLTFTRGVERSPLFYVYLSIFYTIPHLYSWCRKFSVSFTPLPIHLNFSDFSPLLLLPALKGFFFIFGRFPPWPWKWVRTHRYTRRCTRKPICICKCRYTYMHTSKICAQQHRVTVCRLCVVVCYSVSCGVL